MGSQKCRSVWLGPQLNVCFEEVLRTEDTCQRMYTTPCVTALTLNNALMGQCHGYFCVLGSKMSRLFKTKSTPHTKMVLELEEGDASVFFKREQNIISL